MALSQCNVDTDNISQLPDKPVTDGGLTPAQFKAKFDKFGLDLKTYINSTLIPQITAQFQTKLSGTNKLDPAYLNVDSDQLRHIYVVETEPTSASADGIYLVTGS